MSSIQLDAAIRIPVFEPFRRVNAALLDLLRSFTAEEWHRPTVHPDRNVKDLTAHLLQGSLGRVSALRDGYWLRTLSITSLEDLIALIQRNNRDFMTAMRRVSPRILIDLLAIYDRELLTVFEALAPDTTGLGVAWAGEAVSRNWFDIAREYTEKWHHQQQLRDATGRAPLYEPVLFEPMLETFARGLPFALRKVELPEESRVGIQTTGAANCSWTLYYHTATWSLWRG